MTHNFKSIDPNDLQGRDAHRMLIGIVIPRPIAWVSSISADGIPNLAPYSFFNAVSSRPPTLVFSVGQRAGVAKDTLQNIQAVPEFVVHMVDEDHAEVMNLTSGDWAADENEFEVAKLETLPSELVKPPRIASAPIAMEAKATQIIPLDGSPNTLIVGQILKYHVREDMLAADGLVDAEKLRPVTRMGRMEYSTLGRVFSLDRPD